MVQVPIWADVLDDVVAPNERLADPSVRYPFLTTPRSLGGNFLVTARLKLPYLHKHPSSSSYDSLSTSYISCNSYAPFSNSTLFFFILCRNRVQTLFLFPFSFPLSVFLLQKMGKPKLKSSIKAFHQAIINLRPSGPKTMTWVCNQNAKTNSFREEIYKSFNSTYYPSDSSTSSDLYILNEETKQPSSSTLSTDSNDSNSAELALKGQISSHRFFFSPCTTKSIMEEVDPLFNSKSETGLVEKGETEEGEEGDCVIMEVGFCKESMTMEMVSQNPYMDFKISMEEMVQAHGLKEWSCLQDLLHCYLRLNDKGTHRVIVLAFVDLLMNLIAEEPNKNKRLSCFPFLLCLDE
ncbi:uncharacterized protein LOC143892344 [Tasmannia lanceolata]|uniref:uncharacterized protein LOC143892344 n=1 Tax=Tasmannia lanceolata TaxID=3420 RepID=UPI0040635655